MRLDRRSSKVQTLHRTRPLATNKLETTEKMWYFLASLASILKRRALELELRTTKSGIRSTLGSIEDRQRFESCTEHVPWLPQNAKRPKRCGTAMHHASLALIRKRRSLAPTKSRIRSTLGSTEDHQSFKPCSEHITGIPMNSKRPEICGTSMHGWP